MNNYLLPPLGGLRGAANSNPIPKGGGPKGFLIRHIRLISLIRPISPKKTPSPWGRLKGTHK